MSPLLLVALGGAAFLLFGRKSATIPPAVPAEEPFPYPLMKIEDLEASFDQLTRGVPKTLKDDLIVATPNPDYIKKYTTEVVRLTALPIPNTKPPVMGCSYIKVASLDADSPAEAGVQLQQIRQKYESPVENFYGKTGRVTGVRLLRRYFDPKTYRELPNDVLWSSDRMFPIPVDPMPGVPCG